MLTDHEKCGVREQISLVLHTERVREHGVLEIDREQQMKELSTTLSNNKVKLSGIDRKISSLQTEIDRINNRIIKGRMSETKGDEMIDSAISEIHALEDVRQTLIYNNSVINNKLAYLANPLFCEEQVIKATNDDELKALVNKYLRRVTVKKLGHSRYKLTYIAIQISLKTTNYQILKSCIGGFIW